MANPNIVNVSTITGKTAVMNVTTTPADIVVNTANSNTVLKINYLSIANVDGTAVAEITVSLFRGSVEYKIAHTIQIPADASLSALDRHMYLEEGDSLRIAASANGDIQAVCSYEVLG